jgi:hypothetical protein
VSDHDARSVGLIAAVIVVANRPKPKARGKMPAMRLKLILLYRERKVDAFQCLRIHVLIWGQLADILNV